jgi:hypothetical protein
MGGHVARKGEKKNAYRLLVGKPGGRRPLGRPRRRWMDNIRMDFVEVGWGDVDWIGLAQDMDRWRVLANSVLNLRVHKMLGNHRVSKQLGISRVVFSSMELVIGAYRKLHLRSENQALKTETCKPVGNVALVAGDLTTFEWDSNGIDNPPQAHGAFCNGRRHV